MSALTRWWRRVDDWAQQSALRSLLVFVVIPMILGGLPAPLLLLILTLTGDIEW